MFESSDELPRVAGDLLLVSGEKAARDLHQGWYGNLIFRMFLYYSFVTPCLAGTTEGLDTYHTSILSSLSAAHSAMTILDCVPF